MKSTLMLLVAALGASAFTPPRLFGPPRTRASALAYAKKAVFKAEDTDSAAAVTPAVTLPPPLKGSPRAAVATMMVDSWYDKGERLSNNDPMIQWIVESWYDNGVRLTPEEVPAPAAVEAPAAEVPAPAAEEAPAEEEAPAAEAEVQAPLPAGMSAAAAARSPKLAAAALKSEAEIAEIQARLDTFPTKAGTMYTILTGKLKIAQSGLAGIIDQAREAVQAVADEEDLGLMQVRLTLTAHHSPFTLTLPLPLPLPLPLTLTLSVTFTHNPSVASHRGAR